MKDIPYVEKWIKDATDQMVKTMVTMGNEAYLEIYRNRVIERIDLGENGSSALMSAMADIESFEDFAPFDLSLSFLFDMKKVIESELGA